MKQKLYRLFIFRTTCLCRDAPGVDFIKRAIMYRDEWYWKNAESSLAGFDRNQAIETIRKYTGKYSDDCLSIETLKSKRGTEYLCVRVSYDDVESMYMRIEQAASSLGLVLFDPQFDKIYFYGDVRRRRYVQAHKRLGELLTSISQKERPFRIDRLEKITTDRMMIASYVLTVKKNEHSFEERTEEFWKTLSESIIEKETLFCRDSCFHIESDQYKLTFLYEGYNKNGDRIGYIENGIPTVAQLHRMSCLKAIKNINRSWKEEERRRRLDNMRIEELVYKYPNPGDRLIALYKIRREIKKQGLYVKYDTQRDNGGEVSLRKLYAGNIGDGLKYSNLRIEETIAEVFIPCVLKYYPYFYERFYEDNYLPDKMCYEILKETKRVRKMLSTDPFSPGSQRYLKKYNLMCFLKDMKEFWFALAHMDVFIKWLEIQLEESASDEFVIIISGP